MKHTFKPSVSNIVTVHSLLLVLVAPLTELHAADAPQPAAVADTVIGETWLKADAGSMEANFATPPDECRPGTYWWWQNGGVTREEITRHLGLMKDAGIGIAHVVNIPHPVKPDVAGHPGWLEVASPQWADMIAFCVEEAARLGMKFELSPYRQWPPQGDWAFKEDMTEQWLFRSATALKGPQRFEGSVPALDLNADPDDGKNFANYAKRWQRHHQGEPRPELAALVLGQPGEPGKSVLDKVKDDGSISLEIPDGEWQLTAFWRMGGAWSIIDMYSPQAVRGQLDWAAKPVLDRVPKELVGGTFQALYCDNIEGWNESVWTKDLLAFFKERRGYDVSPYLPLLFDQAVEACILAGHGKQRWPTPIYRPRKGPNEELRNRLVYDYNKTLGELNRRGFRAWTEWCHEHGLLSRIEAHNPARGDYIDSYGEADIPEFELYRDLHSPHTGQWVGKFAARQYGKNVLACESFTWLTPHFRATPRDIRESVDQIFAFGGNRINNHGWSYSPEAAGWPGWFFYASSNLNQNNSWFPVYRALADYKARMSFLLRCGRPAADICFYGDEPWFYDRNQPTGLQDCGLPDRPANIPDAPRPTGIYDRISDQGLRTIMEFKEGRLATGHGRYKLMVLRPQAETMPLETLEKIEALVKDGAQVVALQLPKRVPGYHEFPAQEEKLRALAARLFPETPGLEGRAVGKGRTWLVTPEMMQPLVAQLGIRPPVTGAGVDLIHREGPDFDLFYLYNPGTTPINAPLTFAATGRPELWDAKTGEIEALRSTAADGTTTVQLQIPGKASRVVIFRRDQVDTARTVNEYSEPQPLATITGPWQVRFEHVDGRAAFERSFDQLADWITVEELKTFSGAGIYSREFELKNLPEAGARVWIDLGEVRDAAKVRLNGQPVGTAFEAPYRLQVPAQLLKNGANDLEIAVYNRMENAIIPIWTSNEEVVKKIAPPQRAEWKVDAPAPQPSGLLGPVRVLQAKDH